MSVVKFALNGLKIGEWSNDVQQNELDIFLTGENSNNKKHALLKMHSYNSTRV